MVFICSICLETITPEDEIFAPKGCTHCFHVDCLKTSLDMNGLCPICRQVAGGIKKIYLSSQKQEPETQIEELIEEIDVLKMKKTQELQKRDATIETLEADQVEKDEQINEQNDLIRNQSFAIQGLQENNFQKDENIQKLLREKAKLDHQVRALKSTVASCSATVNALEKNVSTLKRQLQPAKKKSPAPTTYVDDETEFHEMLERDLRLHQDEDDQFLHEMLERDLGLHQDEDDQFLHEMLEDELNSQYRWW